MNGINVEMESPRRVTEPSRGANDIKGKYTVRHTQPGKERERERESVPSQHSTSFLENDRFRERTERFERGEGERGRERERGGTSK